MRDGQRREQRVRHANLLQSQSFLSILASLICIVIGLAVGLLILLGINPAHAVKDGFFRILQGGFYMAPSGVGTVLANTAPLVMTGLSVAFAFKTGLFNIGVAGQYTVGAFGALLAAIVFQWPWWACLLFATVFGGVWGAIPGLFKAYLNVNEVITAIMFNWIGLYGINTIIYGGGEGVMYDSAATKTWNLRNNFPAAVIPGGGSEGFIGKTFEMPSATIAIFLAALMAVLVYVVLDRTTFGYELKACGHNRDAAKYAGINEKRTIVLSMLIGGALAGFGAGLYYLSGVAEWNPQVSTALPAMGWNGIPAALLAANNPIGAIFAALFVSHITVGGNYMPTKYFTKEIADVITAVIIYLCAFSFLIQSKLRGRADRRRPGRDAAPSAPDGAAPPDPSGGPPPDVPPAPDSPDAAAEKGGGGK